MKKRCHVCKRRLHIKHFSANRRRRDGKQGTCKQCAKKHNQTYYAKYKKRMTKQINAARKRRINTNYQYVFDYLCANSCIDCDEDDVVVLDFDHVRGKKKAAVIELVFQGFSLIKIETEIAKCEIRCANCHRRKTAKENKNRKWTMNAQRKRSGEQINSATVA